MSELDLAGFTYTQLVVWRSFLFWVVTIAAVIFFANAFYVIFGWRELLTIIRDRGKPFLKIALVCSLSFGTVSAWVLLNFSDDYQRTEKAYQKRAHEKLTPQQKEAGMTYD